MSHQPWTQEQAEKWAKEYVSHYDLEMLANGEGTLEEIEDAIRSAVIAGLAKAAEMIEACPTLYGDTVYTRYGDTVYTSWGEFESHEDTHSAKLVGVRPIDLDESGSKDQ